MNVSRALGLALVLTAACFSQPRPAAAQTPGLPAEAKQALATIHQFIDGFNAGDMKAAAATCAAQTSIIDDFPPHEWHGTNACAQWAHDLQQADKAGGITNAAVRLGAPWRVEVTGTRAYAVVPATYVYKLHGKPVTESNSVFTVALVRTGGTWRITGWAWSER